jgi:hypothetical protein
VETIETPENGTSVPFKKKCLRLCCTVSTRRPKLCLNFGCGSQPRNLFLDLRARRTTVLGRVILPCHLLALIWSTEGRGSHHLALLKKQRSQVLGLDTWRHDPGLLIRTLININGGIQTKSSSCLTPVLSSQLQLFHGSWWQLEENTSPNRSHAQHA